MGGLQDIVERVWGWQVGARARVVAMALVIVAAVTVKAQLPVALDFEAGGEWAANFRQISTNTGHAVQTGPSGSNDYVNFDSVIAVNNFSITCLHDTTPADTSTVTQSSFPVTNALTVTFAFRAMSALSSVGVYFTDPTNQNNNLLALFTIDNTGSTDLFRFYRDGGINVSQGAVGTQVGVNANLSSGVNTGLAFGAFSATLSLESGSPAITFSVGSQTLTQVFAVADVNWTHSTVILRLFDNGAAANGGVSIDDLVITGQGAFNPDGDGDGMPDDWEVLLFGSTTNEAQGDVDADGLANLGEYIADTNPTNQLSYFGPIASIARSAEWITVSLATSSTGRIYDLLVATNLAGEQTWAAAGMAVPGTGGSMVLSLTNNTPVQPALRMGVSLPP